MAVKRCSPEQLLVLQEAVAMHNDDVVQAIRKQIAKVVKTTATSNGNSIGNGNGSGHGASSSGSIVSTVDDYMPQTNASQSLAKAAALQLLSGAGAGAGAGAGDVDGVSAGVAVAADKSVQERLEEALRTFKEKVRRI
jgi:hypothetical protein